MPTTLRCRFCGGKARRAIMLRSIVGWACTDPKCGNWGEFSTRLRQNQRPWNAKYKTYRECMLVENSSPASTLGLTKAQDLISSSPSISDD